MPSHKHFFRSSLPRVRKL